MERRALLATVGVGVGVGLTGCLGLLGNGEDDGREGGDFPGGVDTDDGPTRFEIVGINRPENVRVREDFSVDIGIGNTGGEAGEFKGALVIEEPSAGNSQTIGETAARTIGSGDVETFTLTQLMIPFAGEFELTVNGYTNTVTWLEGAEASITVEPMQGSLGDSYQLNNSYRITPTDIQFEDALRYRTQATGGYGFGTSGERIALQPTVSDEIFAVVTVQAENTGSEQFTLQAGGLGIGGIGQLLTEFPNESVSAEVDLELDSLLGTTINPGSTAQGWLAFFIARENAGDLSLKGYLNAGAENPEAIWTLTEGEVALPTFELTGMTVPEQRQGPNDVFEYTVANTGDGDGTFRGATQWREVGDEDWIYLEGGQIAQIEAGGEATVSADPTDDPRGTAFEYRFMPFDERFTVAPVEDRGNASGP